MLVAGGAVCDSAAPLLSELQDSCGVLTFWAS